MSFEFDKITKDIAKAYYQGKIKEFLLTNPDYKREELDGMFTATFPDMTNPKKKRKVTVTVTIVNEVCHVVFKGMGTREFQLRDLEN